jgi:hypothetical protein
MNIWIRNTYYREMMSLEMDDIDFKRGRYLLYLDILGFKELVRSQSSEVIANTIDNLLKVSQKRSQRIQDFGVLYFSDTILFYQKPQGWGRWAFNDIYAISGTIWSELAAIGIPTRGAITFGDFNVRRDSTNSDDLFWGKALIQAYDLEQSEENRNFIGIIVSPQAWQTMECMESGTVRMLENEHVFRFYCNQTMLLNPFWYLRHAYPTTVVRMSNTSSKRSSMPCSWIM